jgi:hypothetical protein
MHLTPTFGAQYDPAIYGQGYWLFHFETNTVNIIGNDHFGVISN